MADGAHSDSVHQSGIVDTTNQPVEKSAGARRAARQTHSRAFKRQMVMLTLEPGASVARIALDHGLNANLLFNWRRLHLLRARPALKAGRPMTPPLLPVKVSGCEREMVTAPPRGPTVGESAVIEIELAGARILVRGGVDVQALRAVVDVLWRRS